MIVRAHSLYHVSPKANRDSIAKLGIEPVFSKGKRDVCWFVDRSKLMWALAHCSARHGVSVAELDVYVMTATVKRQKRTAWSGVFTSACRNTPINRIEALELVREPQ